MTTEPAPAVRTQRFHLDQHAEEITQRLAAGDPDDLLTPQYLASKFSVSTQWLELRRKDGTGPAYVRLGRRLVRYPRKDALAFIDLRRKAFEKALKKQRA